MGKLSSEPIERKSDELKRLEHTLKEAMAFTLNHEQFRMEENDLTSLAANELDGKSDITLFQNWLTHGMKRYCVGPVLNMLSKWQRIATVFFTSIQPFSEDLEALGKLEGEIQELRSKERLAKMEITEKWLNDSRYSDAIDEKKKADEGYESLYIYGRGRKAR